VGSVQLAEVIDNPEFDLVGLFVESGYGVVDKAGRRDRTGISPDHRLMPRPSGRGAGDRPIGANPNHGR
jgi:hypothetical protein